MSWDFSTSLPPLDAVCPWWSHVTCMFPVDPMTAFLKFQNGTLVSWALGLWHCTQHWDYCGEHTGCSSCPHVTFSIVGKQVYYTSRDIRTEAEYPRSPFQSGLVEELAFWSWPHLQWYRSQLHVWPWVISVRFSQWLSCRAIGWWTRDRGLNKNAARHLGADAREMVTSFSYSFPSHCVTCLKQLLDL